MTGRARTDPGSAPAPATDASSEAGSALRLAVLRLSRRLRQEAAGGEITPSQMSALSVLRARGELTLGELAAIERIAPPSMTRIAARLEANGLLERRADSADRRVARVAISATGTELLRRSRERGDAFVTARLQSLSDEEQDLLDRAVPLLERLAAGAEEPKA
ncbi:MAG TPA: MarR family transcriptional regulator [Acidimicrobiales bacterium]|jgi:DNA-binding MarR family transcriptional regulator|nr:MarR family transcriptional regulator [Acidimicrobiales bacterium]